MERCMKAIEQFHKLAIKRGLTPGAMLEASPRDFDLLLIAVRHQFSAARDYTEREVNEVLKAWLNSSGGMLDVDHVELRRWLIDLQILARDAYGHSYAQASVPQRLRPVDAALTGIDFASEFAKANEHEAQRRAARKAAWQAAQASA